MLKLISHQTVIEVMGDSDQNMVSGQAVIDPSGIRENFQET